MPRNCGKRWRPCSHRWGCGCRLRTPLRCISTKGSTSWAFRSAASGNADQKWYVYTKPSKKAIQSIKDKVSAKTYRSTRHQELDDLLRSINLSLAGWANDSRHGMSKATFSAVDTMRGTG